MPPKKDAQKRGRSKGSVASWLAPGYIGILQEEMTALDMAALEASERHDQKGAALEAAGLSRPTQMLCDSCVKRTMAGWAHPPTTTPWKTPCSTGLKVEGFGTAGSAQPSRGSSSTQSAQSTTRCRLVPMLCPASRSSYVPQLHCHQHATTSTHPHDPISSILMALAPVLARYAPMASLLPESKGKTSSRP